MNPPLTAGLVAKMFDDVSDVDVVAGDAAPIEPPIEHASRGADEWVSLDVLAVSWLLPDEHQSRVRHTFADHGLGCPLVEIARSTVGDGLGQ